MCAVFSIRVRTIVVVVAVAQLAFFVASEEDKEGDVNDPYSDPDQFAGHSTFHFSGYIEHGDDVPPNEATLTIGKPPEPLDADFKPDEIIT